MSRVARKLQKQACDSHPTSPRSQLMSKKTLIAAAAVVAPAACAAHRVAGATLAFNVGAVTDYRYRGISQTRRSPPIQGGIDYTRRLLRRHLGLDDQVDQGRRRRRQGRDRPVRRLQGRDRQGPGLRRRRPDLLVPQQRPAPERQHHRALRRADLRPGDAEVLARVTNLFGFADSESSWLPGLERHLRPGCRACRSRRTSATRSRRTNSTACSYTDYSLDRQQGLRRPGPPAALSSAPDADIYRSPPAGQQGPGQAELVLGVKYNF